MGMEILSKNSDPVFCQVNMDISVLEIALGVGVLA